MKKKMMSNKFFIISLTIIGLLCLGVGSVSATDTNMTISNPTVILLFSFFLLSFGIYKDDNIIGFLCCFASAFIFANSIFNGLIDAELHTFIYILIFVGCAVGVYKSFIAYDDRKIKNID